MTTEKNLQYTIISTNNNAKDTKNFKLKVNNDTGIYLVHRALVQQITNHRKRNSNTKTRSEVKGGGKKPWKQKGTGKARAGSSRSPLWRGGGIVFGPKAKTYNCKINRKEKKLALRTLLYNKFNNTIIVKNLANNINKPHTQTILNRIKSLGINMRINNSILIIIEKQSANFFLSIRNLPNITVVLANQLNIFALLKANQLIITEGALENIYEVYNAEKK